MAINAFATACAVSASPILLLRMIRSASTIPASTPAINLPPCKMPKIAEETKTAIGVTRENEIASKSGATIRRKRYPRNASSSANGTVVMLARTRNAIHKIRAEDEASAKAIGIAALAACVGKRSSAIQSKKMSTPATGASHPQCQSSFAYCLRKIQSVAAAAKNLRGYSHSNPEEAALASMPAASTARNGKRYAAVGFSRTTLPGGGSVPPFSAAEQGH